MHISITKEQLINFILNDVSEEEHKKISEAITTNPKIKERYLFEKRKHDVERYINDEMDLGERCEIEELIKKDSRLSKHFKINNGVFKDEQDVTNLKQIPITEEQLIYFVLNAVYEEERQQITKAINTNPEIKERYLFEKRKIDVERYLDNKMDIGECCEIEELLKTNSRLSEYFELKKELNEEEQNISINRMNSSIPKRELVNFIFNNVTEEERENIIEAINTNLEIKERYLFEKRRCDVERYVYGRMDIGERCEIEELIKKDSRLYDLFPMRIKAIEEEKEEEINCKNILITKEQLVNFILNDVNVEEYEKIIEAIETNSLIKERYLFEKRTFDVERYINNEMDFGECCEIEELLKTNPRLFEYFELHKDVNEIVLTNFIERIKNVHARIYKAIHNNKPDRIEDEVSLKETAPVIEFKLNVMRIGKWIAAASIILLMGLGGVNIYLNNTGSLENRLYAQYYEPLNKIQKYSSSTFIEAKKQFENKEYEIALMLLNEPSKSITSESEKILYQGFILMELKRYDEAIEKFKHLQNINDFEFIKPINNWYLSLCYLKTGENEKIIEQLVKIDDVNGGFYKEAKELLKKLKK